MNSQATVTTKQTALAKLQTMERELSASLIEREEVIRAALIALLARQHLVILGPPGTAKSQLVTALANRISPANGTGLKSFHYLMTRFTTPEELFGPVSVQALKQDEYRRVTTGKLVEAELAFLDEIFKASSAILNALLKITNEPSAMEIRKYRFHCSPSLPRAMSCHRAVNWKPCGIGSCCGCAWACQ